MARINKRAVKAYQKASKKEASKSSHNPHDPRKEQGLSKLGREKYRKAAKLLIVLGSEQAAAVLKNLTPEEAEEISRELAEIEQVPQTEAEDVLQEFGFLKTGPVELKGGPDLARQFLVKTFGKEKGERLFRKAVPFGGEPPFQFLADLEFSQLTLLLKKEPPPVLAVILPYLRKTQSSQLVESLPPAAQSEVMLRLGRSGKVAPAVLERMEETLREKIRLQGKIISEAVDGQSALADILKYMTPDQEASIINEIEKEAPHTADSIREKTYTMDILMQINDQDLQKHLRSISDERLSLILKGCTEDIGRRLLSCVSENRQRTIQLEREYLGLMRKSEVMKEVNVFLKEIRQKEAEGIIEVLREQEKWI